MKNDLTTFSDLYEEKRKILLPFRVAEKIKDYILEDDDDIIKMQIPLYEFGTGYSHETIAHIHYSKSRKLPVKLDIFEKNVLISSLSEYEIAHYDEEKDKALKDIEEKIEKLFDF